jgi:hypothetical protein
MPDYAVTIESDPDLRHATLTFTKSGFWKPKPVAIHEIGAPVIDYALANAADRLFIWTEKGDRADDESVICFCVSTGCEVWRVADVGVGTYGGKILLHPNEKVLDVGTPYGIPNAPYIVRLTYDGREVKRYPASCYDISHAAFRAEEAGDKAAARAQAEWALKTQVSPKTKAGLQRLLGDLALAQGDQALALRRYRSACRLNPDLDLTERFAQIRDRKVARGGKHEHEAELPGAQGGAGGAAGSGEEGLV